MDIYKTPLLCRNHFSAHDSLDLLKHPLLIVHELLQGCGHHIHGVLERVGGGVAERGGGGRMEED